MSPVIAKLTDLASALELLTQALNNAELEDDPLVELALYAAVAHLKDAVELEKDRVRALHEQAKKDLFTIKNLN